MQKIFSILLAFALLVSAGGIVLAQDTKSVELVVDDAETSIDSIAQESASEKESVAAKPVPADAAEPIFIGEDTTSPTKVDSEPVPTGKDAILIDTSVNEGSGITISSAGKRVNVKPVSLGIPSVAVDAQDAGPHSKTEIVDTLIPGTTKPMSPRVGHCYWIMGPCTPNSSDDGTGEELAIESGDDEESVLLAPWQTQWARRGLVPSTGNTQLTGDAYPASANVQLSNSPQPDPKIIGMADGRAKANIAPTENNPIMPPVNPLLGLIGGANAPFLGLLVLLGVGIFLVARNGLKK